MKRSVTRRGVLVGAGILGLGSVGYSVSAGLLSSNRTEKYKPGNVLIENKDTESHRVDLKIDKLSEPSTSNTSEERVFSEKIRINSNDWEIIKQAYTMPGAYRVGSVLENGEKSSTSWILLWENKNERVTGFSTRIRITEGTTDILGTTRPGIEIPDHIREKYGGYNRGNSSD